MAVRSELTQIREVNEGMYTHRTLRTHASPLPYRDNVTMSEPNMSSAREGVRQQDLGSRLLLLLGPRAARIGTRAARIGTRAARRSRSWSRTAFSPKEDPGDGWLSAGLHGPAVPVDLPVPVQGLTGTGTVHYGMI